MAGVLGQFSNGPIQFNDDTGAIESRGTIDRPQPSATQTSPVTAPAATGGGALAPLPPLDRPNIAPGPGVLTGPPGGDQTGYQPLNTADTYRSPIGGGTFDSNPFGGSSNGGSYGASGTGQSSGVNGVLHFEDGGEVDDGGVYSDGTPDQDQSSTIDPMSMIKQVAAFGRKQFGLPTNFTTGQSDDQTMGFDDGGMIPEQGGDAPVTGGGNMPDPRQALRYLTGDGAVSPEIANALESHVDPDGSMDPADRTMAAISAAPNDEAKFGMMQHYRTQYNGFAGGARAAMDQGKLGQAAAHATQAFANVPSGMKVKFAPASGGGIAVMASKIGDAMRNALTSKPAAPQDPNVGVLSNLKGALTSTPQTPAPAAQGDDDQSQSFDDGGEVDDGVIPAATDDATNDTADDVAADAMDATGGDGATQPVQDEQGQPIVLNPDEFKNLMQAGYDKPVDEGWEGLLNSIKGAIGKGVQNAVAYGRGPAPEPTADSPPEFQGPMPGGPEGPQQAGAAGPQAPAGGQTTVGKSDRVSPALQRQMDTPTPLNSVAAQQQANKPTERDTKYQAAMDRAEKTAQRIFPWASQGDQRSNYIQTQMQHYTDNEGKIDLAQQNGRQQIANTRETNKLTIEREKEAGRMARQGNAAHSREDIARMNNQFRTFNSAQREQVRLLGQQLTADPSLARDPNKAMARVQTLSQQLNISPQDMMAIINNGGTPPQAPAQPQPQQAGAKQTVVVFPSGPFAGKPMIRQPNGTYVPAPRQ